MEKSKRYYRSKLVYTDPKLTDDQVTMMILDFSEFGRDLDFNADLDVQASDIFRSLSGLAYQRGPTAAVLQDLLSVLETSKPEQATGYLLQMYSEALRARDWNDRNIGDLVSQELDQPKIQAYRDTVTEIKTDPLISFAVKM